MPRVPPAHERSHASSLQRARMLPDRIAARIGKTQADRCKCRHLGTVNDVRCARPLYAKARRFGAAFNSAPQRALSTLLLAIAPIASLAGGVASVDDVTIAGGGGNGRWRGREPRQWPIEACEFVHPPPVGHA